MLWILNQTEDVRWYATMILGQMECHCDSKSDGMPIRFKNGHRGCQMEYYNDSKSDEMPLQFKNSVM